MNPSPEQAAAPLDDGGAPGAGPAGTSAHSPQADLRGGLAWMGFGALVLAASWRMDRFETMGGTLYTAPGLVPGLFGAMLCLLGAVLVLRSWRRRGPSATVDAAAHGPGPLLNRRIVGTLLLTLVYAAGLIGRVPFSLATVAFVTLFTALYAQTPSWPRRWGLALLTGVLTALLVVGVFEQVFLVRLP